MSQAHAARASHSRQPGFLRATRVFNRLVLPLAGTRLLPLYGVLVQHGRRSGRTYCTPVVVRPTDDGFIVPMPWGEGTDWYRNVRSAGECSIHWRGRDYRLARPEVIDAATAMAAFPASQRAGLRRFGIRQCLRLHQTPAAAV